ncbi:pSer/pThr/pTyr-binding forkhead associated (FHA) protein [Catalinimonas alkaloidigena]|uniref:FHA domain-containing protein n=1 Tax=Catalinimonas alkaloidigena TaxID=1075417 RepID=UPI002404DB9E|nr:FHA domain-containing protein [Catalinimonas alkaloidigena]MDF9798774.1 pSer/pThr/pTyr-binding forkhead associated (FHA) protein [Catalinimonas alkaloidigena]
MSRATQSFKTGMSFIGGGNVPAYTLEFLTASPKHEVSSFETIVVPYIEIGRSRTCAVRFSEEVSTVSRKHAALERKGNDVYIKNLSATNPTLVNGSPVAEEWKLNNGDEFQLSFEGPRLRFNIAQSGSTSMGVTKRIGLVVNQAVRPYRVAVITMISLLIISGLVAGFFIYQLNRETEVLAGQTDTLRKSNKAITDSLAHAIKKNEALKQEMLANKQNMEAQLQSTVANFAAKQKQLVQQINNTKKESPEEIVAMAIAQVKESVFYMGIKNVRAEMDGEVLVDEPLPENCHCTGFLLDDGKFVTARHCVELYFYEKNELNLLASLGGTVTYDFYAVSSDESIRFDFTNHDFMIDHSTDYYVDEEYNGQEVVLVQANSYDGTDWAYFQTDQKGTITAAPQLSASLKSGTELHCLGYTYGNTFQQLGNDNGLEVLYSKASVAKDDLDNNTIIVSGYGFDNGNSGGPLFVIRDGVPKAIAIVSAGYTNPSTGRDDALGSVVPIKNISK